MLLPTVETPSIGRREGRPRADISISLVADLRELPLHIRTFRLSHRLLPRGAGAPLAVCLPACPRTTESNAACQPGLPGLPAASVRGALPHTDVAAGLAVRARCVCADAERDPVCCLCRAMFSAVLPRSRSTSVPMLMGAPRRSPLLLRSPVRFMAKGVKRNLHPPPVPRVGEPQALHSHCSWHLQT